MIIELGREIYPDARIISIVRCEGRIVWLGLRSALDDDGTALHWGVPYDADDGHIDLTGLTKPRRFFVGTPSR